MDDPRRPHHYRPPMKHLLIAAITLLAIATTPARAETSSHSLPLYTTIEHQPQSATLAALAPEADPEVLSLALAAMRCAQAHGVGTSAHRLAVIDYSRSSLTPRLWVFDLARNQLLFHLLVAHGQGSGGDIPQHFSNAEGSHASSLGLFHTLNTYQGSNGYSLRMEGLEPGFNDAAYSRAIVMHGAGYVNANAGQQMGRLGRSWGCPAVRNAMARPVIDVLKDGQFLFAYYPEQKWLMRSSLAQCAQARVRRKQEEATRLASSR